MNRQCLVLGLELESFQRAVTVTVLPYTHRPECYLTPLLKHNKPLLSLYPSPQTVLPKALENECSYVVWGCVRQRADSGCSNPLNLETPSRRTVQALILGRTSVHS